MLDDLLKQIEGVFRDGSDGRDGDQSLNITLGDNCTVVIGNNKKTKRRRSIDVPGSAPDQHGRRDHDQATQQELALLRSRVQALDRLIEHLLLKKVKQVLKGVWGAVLAVSIQLARFPNFALLSQIQILGRRVFVCC